MATYRFTIDVDPIQLEGVTHSLGIFGIEPARGVLTVTYELEADDDYEVGRLMQQVESEADLYGVSNLSAGLPQPKEVK